MIGKLFAGFAAAGVMAAVLATGVMAAPAPTSASNPTTKTRPAAKDIFGGAVTAISDTQLTVKNAKLGSKTFLRQDSTVVVTGRNAALRQKLGELAPSLPTPMTILGYCNNVPELMRASDLLVTKAGPGTIAEASVAEVPVVVYDFVPGQERGNIEYVRTNGIGVVALTTSDVVRSVRRIVSNQERLLVMRAHQSTVAPRGSAKRIAELIADIAIGRLRFLRRRPRRAAAAL